MNFGRTVEKTLPLALLIVWPSPGNVYPQAYGMHVTKQRLLHGVHVTLLLLLQSPYGARTSTAISQMRPNI
jgi:hypothetical protein